MDPSEKTEPFPSLSPVNSESQTNDVVPANNVARQNRPSFKGRPTSNSVVQGFMRSNPPLGMWQATGEVGSKIPTLPEIRDGAFSAEGWSQEGQMERRGTNPHEIHRRTQARRSTVSSRPNVTAIPESNRAELLPRTSTVKEEVTEDVKKEVESSEYPSVNITEDKSNMVSTIFQDTSSHAGPDETGTYPNGYRFPKKHSWGLSIAISLRAFWRFFCTLPGFFIILYGLNVVGWGAMIFFVLLEAAPAMCHPNCSDPQSPRQRWIEIDSQVLNGLFCVTGFGLLPWRIRDAYYLYRWYRKDNKYHRKLAGIYRGWYRLPGSQNLPEHIAPPQSYEKVPSGTDDNVRAYTEEEIKELEANEAVALPISSIPDPPLTGIRAQPSRAWTVRVVIWMYGLNSIIQMGLAGAMWGLNRFDRPSVVTGLLISLGCITGMVAGWVVFREGSKVKKTEGIPVQEYDEVESVEEYQQRKAKEDAGHMQLRVKKTKKVKGANWFTRY